MLTGIDSERLSYRPIVQEDFNEWINFFHHEEAIKLYPFPPGASPEELCQQWLDRQFLRYVENRGGFNALIETKSGKMIGHCGLLVQEIDGIEELEVGYALLPEYWGKGYASEAAIHCKNEAFANNWADSIISIITRENVSSQKVAIRNGMSHDKDSTYQGLPVMIWRTHKNP